MGSTRVTSDRITFRDGSDDANLQLRVTSKGEGTFECVNSGATEFVRLRSTGLSFPLSNDEYVTKSYVDSVATGLALKGQVAYITVGNLISTYAQGTDVDGNACFSLTGHAPWMALTTDEIDVEPDGDGSPRSLTLASETAANGGNDWFGVNGERTSDAHLPFVSRTHQFYYEDGDGNVSNNRTQRGMWPTRILVNMQTNQRENGIYWLEDDGSTSGQWKLTRTENFDGSPYGEIKPGAFVFVADGYVSKGKGFVLTNIDNATSLTVTTDGTDGNNIFFDGFSSAGTIIAGDNIVIDGDNLGTIRDPTFDKVHLGTSSHLLTVDDFMHTIGGTPTRVSRFQDGNGMCYFNSTVVKSSANIETLALLKASNGIQTGGASPTFTVDSHGSLMAKKNITLDASVTSTSANSIAMTLTNAAFEVKNFAAGTATSKFKIEHDTGNTRTSGTLTSYQNAELGTSNTNISTLQVAAASQTTTATGALYVKSADQTSNWLHVAKANGATTILGTTTLHDNFTIKDTAAAAGSEAFTVVKNSGNTTVKGKLVVHAGQTSPFIVDTATETYLLTVKRDNAITVSNSAGTVSVLDVITAPSPTLQLKNDTDVKVWATGADLDSDDPTFKVTGSSGMTEMRGDLKVYNAADLKFSVAASTGNVDTEGTMTIKGATTIEDGNIRVSAGNLSIGPLNSESLIAYPYSNSSDILTLSGAKDISFKNGTDVMFKFNAGDHAGKGDMSLQYGSRLQIMETGNTPVFTVDGTGVNVSGVQTPFVTAACDFKVTDTTTTKFSVLRATGNTMMRGTCTIHSTATIKATGASGVGLSIENGGSRTKTSAAGHEFEILASGTTQYCAAGGSHSTYYKYRDGTGTSRTDVEIGIGASDGHGSVTINAGSLEVVAPDTTNKAIHVQGNLSKPVITTYSEMKGYKSDGTTQSYQLDSQTGTLDLGLGLFRMASSWANVIAATPVFHTSIDSSGNAQFNGATHNINAVTTIENANNLNIQTGQFNMNSGKYLVTNGGLTTQHGNLIVHDTTANSGTGATSFSVTAEGGAVVGQSSIHCVTTLSAAGTEYANALFKVAASGATTLGSTLTVVGASTMHSNISFRNGADSADTCVITSGTGSIDTEGSLNVKLAAEIEEGSLTVTQGALNVQTVTDGHRFSIPTTANTLGKFVGENSTLSFAVSTAGSTADHITMTTGSAPGASQTLHPLLRLREGAIIEVLDTNTNTFFKVHGEDGNISCGSVTGGTLKFIGSDGQPSPAAQMKGKVDLATGDIETQGALAVYGSNTAFTNGTVGDTNFHVAPDTGNTRIAGTANIHKTLTVGDASMAAAHVLVPNGDLKVKTTQFVVNENNVASFQNSDLANDKSVVISSSAANKTWEVSANTGSTYLYRAATLQVRSLENTNTTKFKVDGANGNTTISGGDFSLKSQYSADATYTTFKVAGATGNTDVEGTMTIEGNTQVTTGYSIVKTGNFYVKRDSNATYDDAAPQYRFAVKDSCLADFVSPNVGSDGEKYFYIRDNLLVPTFQILGHTGDTSLKGGKLRVYNGSDAFFTVDPEQRDSDADTHGVITCRAVGANTKMQFVNAGGSATTLSIHAETGNLVTAGTSTLNGNVTVDAQTEFKTSGALDVTTKMLYTGSQTFMQVKGDASKDMQLGPKTGDARLYLTCGGAITSHGGSYTLKDAVGSSAALLTITGSSGQITSRSGIQLVNNGDFEMQDNSQVTKFKVTGSSGSVETQGTLYIGNSGTTASPLWAATVAHDGQTTLRNNLTITNSDASKTRLTVAASSGNVLLGGGNLTIMSDASVPVQTFRLTASTGDVVSTGGLQIDGLFDLRQDGSTKAKITAEGDMFLYGGDVTITNGDLVTNTIELRAVDGDIIAANNVTCGNNMQVDGVFTCAGRVNGLSFLATSDQRLKQNIRVIPGDKALDMVQKLVGRTFEWRNTNKYCAGERVGFIAQEVKEVHESLVHEDQNDGFLKVDYGSTTALLSNAIAELSRQMQQMREDYEVRMTDLQDQLDKANETIAKNQQAAESMGSFFQMAEQPQTPEE